MAHARHQPFHLRSAAWLYARKSTLKWATVLAFALAAYGPAIPASVWPKSAGDTTCDDWMQHMTADQRSGLAMGILTSLTENRVEQATQTQGDHGSGLLAEAITRWCDPAARPRAYFGAGHIVDAALLELRAGGNPIYANCEWNSEPRTCDLRP